MFSFASPAKKKTLFPGLETKFREHSPAGHACGPQKALSWAVITLSLHARPDWKKSHLVLYVTSSTIIFVEVFEVVIICIIILRQNHTFVFNNLTGCRLD